MGLVLCLVFSVSACGFHLKKPRPLAFDTLYTNFPENSLFGVQMRRVLLANSPGLKFVDRDQNPQAQLIQLSNRRSTRELSIDPQGHVEEYELTVTLRFQLLDSAGNIVLPPTVLQAVREIPNDPNAVQAKQGEIATLFNDMEQSLIDRLVRRLNSPDVAENFRSPHRLPSTEFEESSEDLINRPETLPFPLDSINSSLHQM